MAVGVSRPRADSRTGGKEEPPIWGISPSTGMRTEEGKRLPLPSMTFPETDILLLCTTVAKAWVFLGIRHYTVSDALPLICTREEASSPVSLCNGINPILIISPSRPENLRKAHHQVPSTLLMTGRCRDTKVPFTTLPHSMVVGYWVTSLHDHRVLG